MAEFGSYAKESEKEIEKRGFLAARGKSLTRTTHGVQSEALHNLRVTFTTGC